MRKSAPGEFTWFECATRDPARAKAFYSSVFDWTMEDTPLPGKAAGVYTLIKVDGEDMAGLYEMSGPMFEGVPPHWMCYVQVESADESAARSKSLGGEVLAGPMEVPGVGRMAFFRDPTGAAIAVFEPGDHTGSGAGSVLGWCELHTPDVQAAKGYYCELFSWDAKEDADGHYTEWQAGGRSVGGMIGIAPENHGSIPPHWLPYAMVADCDETLEKAVRLGAQVVVPATSIPGVGRFAVFHDPTGATLAVIRLSEGQSQDS